MADFNSESEITATFVVSVFVLFDKSDYALSSSILTQAIATCSASPLAQS